IFMLGSRPQPGFIGLGCAILALAPGYVFHYDVIPKVSIILATACCAIGWAAITNRFPVVSRANGRVNRLGLLLAGYGFSLLVSSALSTDPGLSILGTNWRRMGLIVQLAVFISAFGCAVDCSGRPDRVRWFLRAVSITSIATASYGIAQYLGFDPILPSAAYHVGEGTGTIVRPPSTMGSVRYLSVCHVFAV